MNIGLICEGKDTSLLKRHLLKHDDSLNILEWPNIEGKDKVDVLVLWKHPAGTLSQFKGAKLIASFGAGVDHITQDEEFDPSIALTRIIDPELNDGLFKYVIMAISSYEKRLMEVLQMSSRKQWNPDLGNPRKVIPGILGLGEAGAHIARKLNSLGYEVYGYARSSKQIPGIYTFHSKQLSVFLKKINALVCCLPLTPATRDFISSDLFNQMSSGCLVVNVGRGQHLVEEDLLKAVKEGIVDLAFLDVFRVEPLPPDHPFWSNDKIIITPHIASLTNYENAAAQIYENIDNLRHGRPLIGLVNPSKGY